MKGNVQGEAEDGHQNGHEWKNEVAVDLKFKASSETFIKIMNHSNLCEMGSWITWALQNTLLNHVLVEWSLCTATYTRKQRRHTCLRESELKIVEIEDDQASLPLVGRSDMLG